MTNYLQNRSPTKTLHTKIPIEVRSGKQPSVKHLNVFSCIGHALIYKDNCKKLDTHSIECIL